MSRLSGHNGRHRGEAKGEAAEGPALCLNTGTWADGEYPPDCHFGGELSEADAYYVVCFQPCSHREHG